ncbi:MAG: insulinase family protein [Bacteroidales bacterium]|nr:insulinase family protein [Bacteroidales bacterium]
MNNNYKLIEKRRVKDIDADVFLLEHIKSGARVIKIANNDRNKTFCISFKTEPVDDCGTPHIMEHSVLNGSKKYNVKSPFDQLLKGSLQTFLNAMTGNELTMFPVASICEKDYFNLMDVYLDAVFNPLIYDDPRILMQEGWRMVLENENDIPKYTGVVYNEMKGYYSDPQRELDFRIFQNLFPDNGYGKSSGGYPTEITNLTQEKFTDFHKKNYHPENSYVFFYGDADIENELQILDEQYLSKFSKIGGNYEIIPQKPFDKMKKVSLNYPASEDANVNGDTFLAISFVIGRNTDTKLCLALDILADVLVYQESGIIRNAFQKSGLGSDIEVSFENSQQPVFSFIAHNCNKGDSEKFKNLIFNTLKDVVKNGIDKSIVSAVVNRREFILREGNDAQLGLKYLSDIIMPWLFDNNPIKYLESSKILSDLKNSTNNGYLEEVIDKYFINNNHSLLTEFIPQVGLEAEIEANIKNNLVQYKNNMTKEQINKLIEDTRLLDEFQNQEETPEQLKCIPTLSKEDINPNAENYIIEPLKIDDVDLLYREDATNGIVYTKFMFDLRTLDFQMLPYVGLLTELYCKLDTKNLSFGEIDKLRKTYTGGLTSYTNIYAKIEGKEKKSLPKFFFSVKMLLENIDKSLSLVEDIMLNTKFQDKVRLKELISRHFSQLEADISSSAFYYVKNRADSYYDNASFIDEYLSGIDYYYFVKDLNENFDTKVDDLINNLTNISKKLFNKNNMVLVLCCENENKENVISKIKQYIQQINSDKVELNEWKLNLCNKNEAFTGSSKVQYVIKSYNFRNSDFNWTGSMSVLSKILSLNYLHNAIRVRGGAYGSFAQITHDGSMIFSSYRDPNLVETINVYNNVSEFLENLEISDDEMLKYIIGTISSCDQPMTVSQKTKTAINRYLSGKTLENIQKVRNEIINTSLEDIKKAINILKDFEKNGSICVFASDEKANNNAKLFNKILKLTK